MIAEGALAPDRLLRERAGGGLAGLPLRSQREVAKVNAGASLIATDATPPNPPRPSRRDRRSPRTAGQ